jgi:hypothetical protein
MPAPIVLKNLTEANFADFETITNCEDKGCFCSFWYQKWSSIEEWDQRKEQLPGWNRELVLGRIRSGFHVGVIAYRGSEPVAWLSVGPIPEIYWAWKRIAAIGEAAAKTACIPCLTRNPRHRDSVGEAELLRPLAEYGRARGWIAIEGYPFDVSTIAKQGDSATWPGETDAFEQAGFTRIAPHWLSGGDWQRSIYRLAL